MSNLNTSTVLKNLYLILIGIITFYYCLGSIADIYTDELFERAQLIDEDSRSQNINGATVVFRNLEELKWSKQHDILINYYPTFEKLGDTLSYILSLIFFGILGALVKILAYNYIYKKSLDLRKVYLGPILGGLLGFMVLVLADFLPEFKFESGDKKFYFSIAFVVGMFSEKFFGWLRRKADEIFKVTS